jgi:CheY-like chemotaxis protein
MPGTILIVDDDPGVRDTARLVLAREGYGIMTAPDGQTAMDMMAAVDSPSKVCTILCDLEMPKMSGKEFIDRCRIAYPDIPIIVLSAASDTVFLDVIVREGVCDWIRKPVTREVLLDKVRTATNLFSLRQQHR